MSKNRLACYIRVSREDDNEGESNSIKNQRALLRAFVESAPDLSRYEAAEFCDDGYSGTNFDRPGVKALLEEVRAGNIHCIIVKDLSRFGRSYIDIGDYLEQIFPFLGVRFISVNDRFDSSEFDGTTGGLDIGFRNLVYALYSRDLSQKVCSAKKTRMEKGEFIGSYAPYGYIKSHENRNKLVVDQPAACVVRRLFAMADAGKSAVEIAAALNSEHIPTPAVYKRLAGCIRTFNVAGRTNHWLNTTVLTILHDERYTGKMVGGKRRSPVVGCGQSKRVPKSAWIIVPDTHEAIISEALFTSVQARFRAPARTRTAPAKIRPLLGKVKCGVCRRGMKRSGGARAAAYYYCESHRYAADNGCPMDRISESSLIRTVLSVIRIQMAVLIDEAQLFDRMKTQNPDSAAPTEQLVQFQAARAKLGASKVTAYEKYKAGALDRDSYISQKADIDRRIAKTDAQIAALERVLQSSCEENRQPDAIMARFQRLGELTELSKDLADQLIGSIYVYGGEAIEITWRHTDAYSGLV